MEYYSAIKKNTFESVLMRWMKLELIIQSEVSQKEKHQYSMLLLSHFSRVRLFPTPWTATYQTPPPVGSSRQEYWSGVPYTDMNQPWVYMCSPSHPSESSQCTSPEHPVLCIEPGLAIYFTYDNMHVSVLFSLASSAFWRPPACPAPSAPALQEPEYTGSHCSCCHTSYFLS